MSLQPASSPLLFSNFPIIKKHRHTYSRRTVLDPFAGFKRGSAPNLKSTEDERHHMAHSDSPAVSRHSLAHPSPVFKSGKKRSLSTPESMEKASPPAARTGAQRAGMSSSRKRIAYKTPAGRQPKAENSRRRAIRVGKRLENMFDELSEETSEDELSGHGGKSLLPNRDVGIKIQVAHASNTELQHRLSIPRFFQEVKAASHRQQLEETALGHPSPTLDAVTRS